MYNVQLNRTELLLGSLGGLCVCARVAGCPLADGDTRDIPIHHDDELEHQRRNGEQGAPNATSVTRTRTYRSKLIRSTGRS